MFRSKQALAHPRGARPPLCHRRYSRGQTSDRVGYAYAVSLLQTLRVAVKRARRQRSGQKTTAAQQIRLLDEGFRPATLRASMRVRDPLRTFCTTIEINGTKEWEGAVNQKEHKHLSALCQCGKVKFEAVGPPILTGSCYCTSCQEAGRVFEQLASAPPVLDPDSGTGLILYRKDRVQCMLGQRYLEEHRLKPDSPTRRVIAKCCNSAMFLDFTKGHWLSMFRNRFPTGAPPLEMRVWTKQ